MAGVASVAAVALAAVFGWAALAKSVRYRPTVSAFRDLGLPAPRPLALAAPASELLIAGALLSRPDIGGLLALATLAVFTAVVVRAVARGATTGCGCFGSRRDLPVSGADVVRNGLLAALAVLATGTRRLVRPGPGALAAMVVVVVAGVALQAMARRRLGRPTPVPPPGRGRA